MTLELADGRGELFQWDAGRIIEFGDDTVSQAHFTSIEKITDIPYTIEVKNRKAAIPDELLQVPGTLIVYAWVSDTNGGYTKAQVNFPVFARPKPSDYVYTPTEHAGFDRLRAEIGDLSALQTDAKDNLVTAINEVALSSGTGSMSLRVADGYIQYSNDGSKTWENLIAVAELKGADGKPGAAGADGVTPHIGDNGNWYLGTIDTGKPSKGEQGPGAEVFYIDLAGDYPTYTCPVAMADIKAAYEAGKVLKCRCSTGNSIETLPLVTLLPSGAGWVFSSGGALSTLNRKPTLFTVAITEIGVLAEATEVVKQANDLAFPNPNALTVKIGSTTVTYDGSSAQTVEIADGTEVSY